MLNVQINGNEKAFEAQGNATDILTDLTYAASCIITQLNKSIPEHLKGKLNFYDIVIKGLEHEKELSQGGEKSSTGEVPKR